MKKVLIILLLIITIPLALEAQKFHTRSGHIWFYSEAPLENIEAHNYQVSSVVDAATGEMAFSLLIRGFQFEKALMQEHFNDRFLNSEKFPRSTFEGRITNLNEVDFSKPGKYTAKVSGKLTIHGVTRDVTTTGIIEVGDNKITAKATFPVTVADYNIQVPAVVRDNIARIVDVHVDMEYTPR